MAELRFEWDPNKAAANPKKHHCLKDECDTIRIISARKAVRAEREAYLKGRS